MLFARSRTNSSVLFARDRAQMVAQRDSSSQPATRAQFDWPLIDEELFSMIFPLREALNSDAISTDEAASALSSLIGHTRLASGNKLLQTRSPDNSTSNFYFNRLPRIWNALPVINYQDNPLKIKAKLLDYLWNHFTANFTSNNTCSFSFLCPCSKCSKIPHQPNFNSL